MPRHAFEHAVAKGATPYEGDDKTLDVPAIVGIGGSLLYFVERYGKKGSAYDAEFEWLGERDPKPEGVGFYYLDHLTHNVYRGNMDKWWAFYRELFNFRQIHFFDIEGKLTGLVSRAITSPCGKIRIPINESTDDRSQIEEYLRKYHGEGIQHIAVGTEAIYDATDRLAANGLDFMPGPPDTYYEKSLERVAGHDEPMERMKRHGILIDGEGVVDGGDDQDPAADLLQDGDRADLLRVHPAQGRRRLRRRQFPRAVRIDRGRPDPPRRAQDERGGLEIALSAAASARASTAASPTRLARMSTRRALSLALSSAERPSWAAISAA